MESKVLVVEPIAEYGQCRCCLAFGYHKNLMKDNSCINGKRVFYYAMLTECFNLFLSSNHNLNMLICMSCIRQLLESYEFRNKVIASEEQLLATVRNQDTVFINVPTDNLDIETNKPLKIENELKMEIMEELPDDFNRDDEDFNQMETEQINNDVETPLKSMSLPPLIEEHVIPEAMELITKYRSELKPLPRKCTLNALYPEFVRKLNYLKDDFVTSDTVENYLNYTSTMKHGVDLSLTEKYAVINNASVIVECSNVTPFRSKNRIGFPCFYCKRPFETLKEIQEHQSKNHKRAEFKSVLATYGSESTIVVYVDVTDLQCTICEEKMLNLTELKKHLTETHKKNIYMEYHDKVIPFKLSTDNIFECQSCRFSLETFGSIERHMSSMHYRNYVCDKCGTGFITKHRLKIHIKNMHVPGNYTCENCKKIFTSQQKLKNHFETVHEAKKRFKCPKCPVRFTEYFQRQKHLESVHGVAPLEYKCNVCDRSFNRRYTLSRHMKRDHLEERDFQCEICSYKCFTNNELRGHMIKHSGERIHECSVCKKSYARKKTLREHMRIHNNDRRFSCEVCGQAFVQKCSLKGHIKTHHESVHILESQGKSGQSQEKSGKSQGRVCESRKVREMTPQPGKVGEKYNFSSLIFP